MYCKAYKHMCKSYAFSAILMSFYTFSHELRLPWEAKPLQPTACHASLMPMHFSIHKPSTPIIEGQF